MNRYWNKKDILTFGKYKGCSLKNIIMKDVSYITWCIENLPDFILENEMYELYERFAETP